MFLVLVLVQKLGDCFALTLFYFTPHYFTPAGWQPCTRGDRAERESDEGPSTHSTRLDSNHVRHGPRDGGSGASGHRGNNS
ncbi:hypothetical protein HDK90DRAFT_499633 [Phyllosticta capitalensis]|uniref:Secreted protein n=1 Tax=Phyllosticta capitalensis TaxID=121624 RepID=A0ABR1Y920_9PEZI